MPEKTVEFRVLGCVVVMLGYVVCCFNPFENMGQHGFIFPKFRGENKDSFWGWGYTILLMVRKSCTT